MSSIFTGGISVSIFGESHGNGIGVVLDNLPAGIEMDVEGIYAFMARRAPRKDGTSTFRSEKDIPEIMSGVFRGKTTGTPLCAVIKNSDNHSSDYDNIKNTARNGHADYSGYMRYSGANDYRGGGHFSGRLTAPLCFAGAVCGQILAQKGIVAGAHILSVKDINDRAFSPVNVCAQELTELRGRYLPLLDTEKDAQMREVITNARENGDSVGGVVECAVVGVPAGIGSPIFDGAENVISRIIFGIPAVKSIEFGNGYESAQLFGSENNDEFFIENGVIKTRTNNHGGILGGITTGMPILFKTAFKPTPSIAKRQNTVDFVKKEETTLEIKGRHDPCIVPRAVVCVEAAANIAILSLINQN